MTIEDVSDHSDEEVYLALPDLESSESESESEYDDEWVDVGDDHFDMGEDPDRRATDDEWELETDADDLVFETEAKSEGVLDHQDDDVYVLDLQDDEVYVLETEAKSEDDDVYVLATENDDDDEVDKDHRPFELPPSTLKALNTPIFEGSPTSFMELVNRLLRIQADRNASHQTMEDVVKLLHELFPMHDEFTSFRQCKDLVNKHCLTDLQETPRVPQ